MIRPHGSGVTIATIRTIHTAVFLFNLSSIIWLVVTGLQGRRDRTVGVAAVAVAIEAAVFVGNDRVCPLTRLTERYGATRGSVSDIFLPDVVARTIPIWATSLVGLGVVLHVRAAFRQAADRRWRMDQSALATFRRLRRCHRPTATAS